MIRYLLVILCFFNLVVAKEVSWQTLEKKVYLVLNSYQKGKSRELMGAYKQAVDAYSLVLEESQSLIQNPAATKEQVLAIFPYMIASAYRLSLSTEKMIDGRMVYLYDQIESYKNSDDLISQTLTNISTMRIDHKIEIPVVAYAHLYYARALTSMGMAYTLSDGTLWKKYLVYMPSDTVQIVHNAEADLNHYLLVQGITASANHTQAVQSFVAAIVPQSTVDTTIKLSYYTASSNELVTALVARVDNGVMVFNERLKRDDKLLKAVANCKTYEEYEESDSTRPFIVEMKTLLELLKNN